MARTLKQRRAARRLAQTKKLHLKYKPRTHVNTNKHWTAEENRIARGLNPSGNALSLIKNGGA